MKIRMTGRGGRGVGGALARLAAAVLAWALAVWAAGGVAALRGALCAGGCGRERPPRNRALAENIRRGVYPAGDWDAAEFSVGGGSGRRAVGMKEGVWER